MHDLLLPLLLLSAAVSIAADMDLLFSRYMKEYHKTYVGDELEYRRQVFTKNYEMIQEHNAKNASWTMEVNKFTDLTDEEFEAQYLGFDDSSPTPEDPTAPDIEEMFESNIVYRIPKSVDWREKGMVTPVKDQKRCGSCWAFATVAAVESAMLIKYGKNLSLSEQQLLDCALSAGCRGGEPSWALNYVLKHGLCSEEQYPYDAKRQQCHRCSKVASVHSYYRVKPLKYAALMYYVSRQPVLVSIDSRGLKHYKSGISSAPCSALRNHAVLIVGYGQENGHRYWIVKNSWGADWGEQGFFRLKRVSSSKGFGKCGIRIAPYFPVV
jgi:C1A family cysteine protease